VWSLNLKVGVTVLAGIFILIFLLMNATDSPFERRGDLLIVHFNFINDLRVGAGVMLSGVQIGRVTSVRLLDNGSKVEVELRVERAFQRLRQGSQIQIGIIGFVGEAYIHIKNGPMEGNLLTVADLPLTGLDPESISETLNSGAETIAQVTELIQLTQKLIENNQYQVEAGITDLRQLIQQISQSLDQTRYSLDQTLVSLSQAVDETRTNLQITLDNLNTAIEHISTNLSQVAQNATIVTESAEDLIHQNRSTITQTIATFQRVANDLQTFTQQMDHTLNKLESETSDLMASGRNVVNTELSKLDQALAEFGTAGQNFNQLNTDLQDLVSEIKNGDGSLSRLIHQPDLIQGVEKTLHNLDQTLEGTTTLTREWAQKSTLFRLPEIGWSSEIRYVALDDQLQSELMVAWLPSEKQRIQIGFGQPKLPSFGSATALSFQYRYDLIPFLRGRVKITRSGSKMATDLMLFDRRAGLTFSALSKGSSLISLTRSETDALLLGAEVYWKITPMAHLLLGIESSKDSTGFQKPYLTAGFRLADAKW